MNRVPRLEALALAVVLGPRNLHCKALLRELVSKEEAVVSYLNALNNGMVYCRYCLRFTPPNPQFGYWSVCYKHPYLVQAGYITTYPGYDHL